MTTTTSYCVAVGGKPVLNLAFTTARRLPKRAAAVWSATAELVDAHLLHEAPRPAFKPAHVSAVEPTGQ